MSPSGPPPQSQRSPADQPSAGAADVAASTSQASDVKQPEQSAANAAGGSQPTIFVSYREVKGPPSMLARAKKPSYVKRFYLVDSHGNETLAATGEDQGDAHYIYKNAEGFTQYGTLDCHNRRELVSWLDQIKQSSQDAAGFHLVEDPPDQVLASSPVGSPVRLPNFPPFVAYRQEKFSYEDGHRGQRWFLVDESGHEQLAVTAEERETRDGHYTYKAEGPLAQQRPLVASNMGMVQEWLEQMLQHPADPHLDDQPTMSGGRLDRGKAGGMGSQRKSKSGLLDFSHPLKKSTGKRSFADLASFEEAKRQRLMAMEGTEAGDREFVIVMYRKLAAKEAASRQAACKASLAWLQTPVRQEQTQQVELWIAALQTANNSLDFHDSARASAPGERKSDQPEVRGQSAAQSRGTALLDALNALRRICSTSFSLPLLAATDIVQILQRFSAHREASIAELAARGLEQIQVAATNHVAVLTSPKFLQDPVAAAEASLKAMAAGFAAKTAAPQSGSHGKGLLAGVTPGLQSAGAAEAAATAGFAGNRLAASGLSKPPQNSTLAATGVSTPLPASTAGRGEDNEKPSKEAAKLQEEQLGKA